MESLRSRALKLSLRLIDMDAMWYYTGDRLRAYIANPRACEGVAPPPRAELTSGRIRPRSVDGRYVYTIPGRPGANTLFFIHGGGWILGPLSYHWRLCLELNRLTGATVVIPDYPLVPHADCLETLAFIQARHDETRHGLADRPRRPPIVMGDSAGGNLALVLAQQLAAQGQPPPAHTILLSPALDLTLSDPRAALIERIDPMLGSPALTQIGLWYANGLPLDDPRVSPLYGDLAGLGPITVFTGTADMLYPGAEGLGEKAASAGLDYTAHVYPHMIHDWMLVPWLPEARRATRQIVDLLRA
ncbi:MAG: alpha/beta hydrolase [Propionibacteriaceae bacterium]|jgi:acetyl esterase/lipase|nr:alpha/beta hydrolase [Propionibacteriaceae bacterium]